MADSLLSRFADFVVYLLPGLLLLLSAIYRYTPDRLKHPETKLGLGELTLFFAGAYLIGMVTFRVSDEFIHVLEYFYDENPLVGIIRKFPDLPKITSSLHQQLGIINTDNPVVSYRYAAAVVLEKSPRSAEAAERLMALAHLFRNLLICLPITILLLWQPLWRRFRWKVTAIVACAVALEYLFLKTFLEFWASGVWKYLRAYLVWSALK